MAHDSFNSLGAPEDWTAFDVQAPGSQRASSNSESERSIVRRGALDYSGRSTPELGVPTADPPGQAGRSVYSAEKGHDVFCHYFHFFWSTCVSAKSLLEICLRKKKCMSPQGVRGLYPAVTRPRRKRAIQHQLGRRSRLTAPQILERGRWQGRPRHAGTFQPAPQVFF